MNDGYLSTEAAVKAKELQREQLEIDMHMFLARGGVIKQIPKGEINGQIEPTRRGHNERSTQTDGRRDQRTSRNTTGGSTPQSYTEE